MVDYAASYREGRTRTDVTPVFADGKTFRRLADDLLALDDAPFDVIAGIDALGFIIGGALAMRSGKGFVPIRKGGKLPHETEGVDFTDYSGAQKRLELTRGVLEEGARVLLVDDWMETGAQVRAAIALIERQGATVSGVLLLAAERNGKTEDLFRNYRIHSLQVVG